MFNLKIYNHDKSREIIQIPETGWHSGENRKIMPNWSIYWTKS